MGAPLGSRSYSSRTLQTAAQMPIRKAEKMPSGTKRLRTRERRAWMVRARSRTTRWVRLTRAETAAASICRSAERTALSRSGGEPSMRADGGREVESDVGISEASRANGGGGGHGATLPHP